MKFQRVNAQETVINHGDIGDQFFIILKGVVSVQIPNPNIEQRHTKKRDFERLLKWKKEDFDPRVKAFKDQHTEDYIEQ